MHKRKTVVFLGALVAGALLQAACGTPEVIPLPPTHLPLTETPISISAAFPSPSAEPSRLLNVTIAAPSLKQNLLGDPADRNIGIYLPPSYFTTDQRYPVIYFLPDFGDQSMLGVSLPDDVDRLIKAGTIKEMIIVIVSGVNLLGGSFYVNSPVTGNWDDFVTRDVVGYIDTNYRTLTRPASRGIAGHSMGGFGALNLAMLHPNVFGVVYGLSPELLAPDGLGQTPMLASQSTIAATVDTLARESVLPADQAVANMQMASGDTRLALAYAAAFAPDLERNPPIDYPYRRVSGQLVRDDAVWQRWEDGLGGLADKVQLDRGNLMRLNGILVDYGLSDPNAWIPAGCEFFSAQLTVAGIPNSLVRYAGDHQTSLGERIRVVVLPFFSQKLSFTN